MVTTVLTHKIPTRHSTQFGKHLTSLTFTKAYGFRFRNCNNKNNAILNFSWYFWLLIDFAMTDRKPKVIVFDLDYTLWPFWVDTHVTPPFRRGKGNEVLDTHGKKIKHYPEVTEILKKLNEDGYEIGVASRTSEIEGASQLVQTFGWDEYIKYQEIYPGCKVKHFSKIKNNSNVDYKDMIFFDDEHRNIDDLTKLGVLSILVQNGITKTVIDEGLNKFFHR